MEKTIEKPEAPVALSNITKRQQISKSNRNIFIWVVMASVVIVACLIACTFLVRQALFNQKIISQKSKANATIVQNIENAKVLKKNVDALIADTNLAAVKTPAESNNLQVVFDALPTSGDATTLTNSIYTQILQRAGVGTDSITVGSAVSASGAAAVPVATAAPATAAAPTPESIALQTSVTGNVNSVAAMLSGFEQSIRPMNLNKLSFSFINKGTAQVNVVGETYFLKADSVKLSKKEIKP